jgi:hypothetical protein
MSQQELDNIYTHHKPTTDQIRRHADLRVVGLSFATLIERTCPQSREASLAKTAVQEAVMWANAAIAINESGAD